MSPFSPPLLPKTVEINVNIRVRRQKRWGKRHRDGQMVFPFRIRKVITFHFSFFAPFLPLDPCTVILQSIVSPSNLHPRIHIGSARVL